MKKDNSNVFGDENFLLPDISPKVESIRKNIEQSVRQGMFHTLPSYHHTLTYNESYIKTEAYFCDSFIKLVESRPRFSYLKKYVKMLRRSKNENISLQFLINADTTNDAYIAMLYLLYHIKEEGMAGTDIDYKKIYHMSYQQESYPSDDYVETDDDSQPFKQAQSKEENDDSYAEDEYIPVWKKKSFPMFVGIGMFEPINNCVAKHEFPIVFVLNPQHSPRIHKFGRPVLFNNEPLQFMGNPDNYFEFVFSRYKPISVLKAGNDEYKKAFRLCASMQGMGFAKEVDLDEIIKNYIHDSGYITDSEAGVCNAVLSICENKLINSPRRSKMIELSDFTCLVDKSIFESRDSGKVGKKHNPWLRLDALIGNDDLKKSIKEMVYRLLLDKKREKLGISTVHITMHAAFMGAPGTSKTTVARLIAEILKYEGIIPEGNFKECTKSDIIGKYVGWTAENVDSIFSELSATGGGVLFLDEAYSYTQDQTSFDKEAVNCIVQNMENYKNIMVIFAGYKEEMKQFIETNPGIRSRISFLFEFPSYGVGEMIQITKYQAHIAGFEMPVCCEGILANYYENIIRIQGDYFGNGREARKLVEFATIELAARIFAEKKQHTKKDYARLKKCDFEAAINKALRRENSISAEGVRRIGFK